MRAHRAIKTDEEKSYEREAAKIRMRNLRKEKSKEDTDYDNLKRREKMRTVRKEESKLRSQERNETPKGGGKIEKVCKQSTQIKEGSEFRNFV